LSGISGTGKTKIVQLFAESIGANSDNGQFKLIPVRPDWSDGSDLIGYVDLKGEFKSGPLTEILVEANKPENRNKPYFILLDEMNLARVEYYFSDLLSIMETKRHEDGVIRSDIILDREETGKLMLLDNVYIIGTVNMDETTHPFSKKVLDRANTIEYNDVHLDVFDFLQENEHVSPITITNNELAGPFLNLKDAYNENETLIKEVTRWLVEINTILEDIQCQFAYRVRDEICFYMIYNEQSQLLKRETAFDYQLYQKILPRITGNDEATTAVLKKLFAFCTNHAWEEGLDSNMIKESRFPKSAQKIAKMIKKNGTEGFTSFWLN
jgi:5-methylcytosine-specific restriction enzyme B